MAGGSGQDNQSCLGKCGLPKKVSWGWVLKTRYSPDRGRGEKVAILNRKKLVLRATHLPFSKEWESRGMEPQWIGAWKAFPEATEIPCSLTSLNNRATPLLKTFLGYSLSPFPDRKQSFLCLPHTCLSA
jgi:hypothetical protein